MDAYDRTRPGYPAEAIDWSLGAPAGSLVVCDLGAGTGLLTRALLDRGHRVIAVEPDAAMRERLWANLAGARVEARDGSAEALPLDDAEVDAVLAGQAWHWFDEALVGPELARVVRPGGAVATLWNTRDESVDWVARWSALAEEHAHPTGRRAMADGQAMPAFGPAFAAPEQATFRHAWPMAAADIVTLAASRSWTITLPEERRERLLGAIADLVATHPDLAGRDEVTLPYVVECVRARRPPQ